MTESAYGVQENAGDNNGLRLFLFLGFLLTGSTGLAYQVLWERLLVLSFGYTIHSVTIVITAFMGGLALGSFVGGIFADRVRKVVFWYGLAELLIGVMALLTYPLFAGLPRAIADMREVLSIPYSGFSLWSFAISAALILVPTFLMGLTLPLLARVVTRAGVTAARDVGTLYAVNTFGAAAGAVLTGFVLIAAFGVHSTLLIAAVVNISVGFVAITFFRSGARGEPSKDRAASSESGADKGGSVLGEPVFWAFGVSGFVAMACEVVWIRLLTPYLENSTYAFSIVLGVFLLGIASGGWAGRKAAVRVPGSVYGFGICQVLVGLATGLGFIFLFAFIGRYSGWLADGGFLLEHPSLIFEEGLGIMAILLPSTFFMGAGFPFIAQWAGKDFGRLGSRTGKVYAANTVGSILGTLAGGFLFLPLLGTKDSMVALVAVNFLNGFIVIYLSGKEAGRLKGRVFAAAAALLAVFSVSLFMQDNPNLFALNSAYNTNSVVAYREDPDVNVALLESKGKAGKRTLNINLRPVSGESIIITPWMSHLPLLLYDGGEPRRLLNIGLGVGYTFKTALQYPELKVDVVELVPSVADLFREFDPEAGKVLSDGRGRIIIGDGRNFLLSSREPYDVVLIDPTPPLYGTGAVNLYTRDFFEIVREKLSPRGILALRIPVSADEVSTRLVIRTAMEVFPHVSLWTPPTSTVTGFTIVASAHDYNIDGKEVSRRFMNSPFIDDLSKEYLLGLRPILLADRTALAREVEGMPVVTDDRPHLEFPLF